MRTKRLGLCVGSVGTAVLLLTAACSSSGSGTRPSGVIHLVMWTGFSPAPPGVRGGDYESLKGIIADYTRRHPKIHISLQYVNDDFALQKVTAALQGGGQPDISYQYGSSMPQIAQMPGVVNLTQLVRQPGWAWSDLYPVVRDGATVGGQVLGVPAVVDNLAVVYNKTLFAEHHLAPPSAHWTWSELAADANAITDPNRKIFGLTFPADGSESTVWEYEAMLWEAGGEILAPGNGRAAFDSPAGVRALAMLGQMRQAHSLSLDLHPDKGLSSELFNSGKIGMIITGPWDLSNFAGVHHGVQYMPSFDPGGSHQTISGPDNWVVFDNGPARVQASLQFLRFLDSPLEVLKNSLRTGELPPRLSVQTLPSYPRLDKEYPGVGLFTANLRNVLHMRPQIAQYPQLSAAIGRAVVEVLLGRATPQAALRSAAQQVDGYLAVGG
jgi:multiple sugar transport system substrate-binding protein